MEKYITIPTSDWFEIKWVLNWEEKYEKLIIIVHGLTGSMTEAHYYAAKEYFVWKWFEVFRFNLYTDWKNTRKLNSCSVTNHSQDISTVLDFFKDYKETHIMSHSLGWPSVSGVLEYPKNIEKIVFWDPAFDMTQRATKCYFKNESIYTTISGKEIEISQEMYREFTEGTFLDILQKQRFPTNRMFAIYADNGGHIIHKEDTDILWIESYIIEWANHWFTQEWKYKELFDQTLHYIEK